MSPEFWFDDNAYKTTEYLGRLGALVPSKISGQGSSEMAWKSFKHGKAGQHFNCSHVKNSKKSSIALTHSAEKALSHCLAATMAREVWEDKDFEFLKLDDNCYVCEIVNSATTYTTVRSFHAWKEEWDFDPEHFRKEDPIHEAHLTRKCGVFKWLDPDYANTTITACPDKMVFYRGDGPKHYVLIGMKPEYDRGKPENVQPNAYETWEVEVDLYGQIVEYYEHSDDLTVFTKDNMIILGRSHFDVINY